MSKTLIWFGMIVGSGVGGYFPTLFGSDMLSGWSLLGSIVGGVAGVFAGNKVGRMLG